MEGFEGFGGFESGIKVDVCFVGLDVKGDGDGISFISPG
jgi:hypothetical protein